MESETETHTYTHTHNACVQTRDDHSLSLGKLRPKWPISPTPNVWGSLMLVPLLQQTHLLFIHIPTMAGRSIWECLHLGLSPSPTVTCVPREGGRGSQYHDYYCCCYYLDPGLKEKHKRHGPGVRPLGSSLSGITFWMWCQGEGLPTFKY